jgi:hypothetical protein
MNEPEKPASAPSLGGSVEAAFEEYYLAVGKVARAWNTLHEYLGQLFVTASGADWTQPWVAFAIWYSVKSDRAQRDMLKAAVFAQSGLWEKLPKALDDLKWLLDRCDELAEHRNDAVHAPCSIYIGSGPNGAEMGPAYFAAGNPRVKTLKAKNLMGKQLIAEFDWCERYAWTLIGFIQKLEKPLTLPDRYPWPDRPPRPTRKTKP